MVILFPYAPASGKSSINTVCYRCASQLGRCSQHARLKGFIVRVPL